MASFPRALAVSRCFPSLRSSAKWLSDLAPHAMPLASPEDEGAAVAELRSIDELLSRSKATAAPLGAAVLRSCSERLGHLEIMDQGLKGVARYLLFQVEFATASQGALREELVFDAFPPTVDPEAEEKCPRIFVVPPEDENLNPEMTTSGWPRYFIILLESIRLFPLNWTAWIDFISFAILRILPINEFRLPETSPLGSLLEPPSQCFARNISGSQSFLRFCQKFDLPDHFGTLVAFAELSLVVRNYGLASHLLKTFTDLHGSAFFSERQRFLTRLPERSPGETPSPSPVEAADPLDVIPRAIAPRALPSIVTNSSRWIGGPEASLTLLLCAVSLDPKNASTWRQLGDLLSKQALVADYRLHLACRFQEMSCRDFNIDELRGFGKQIMKLAENEKLIDESPERAGPWTEKLITAALGIFQRAFKERRDFVDACSICDCLRALDRFDELGELWAAYGAPYLDTQLKLNHELAKSENPLLREVGFCDALRQSTPGFLGLVEARFLSLEKLPVPEFQMETMQTLALAVLHVCTEADYFSPRVEPAIAKFLSNPRQTPEQHAASSVGFGHRSA